MFQAGISGIFVNLGDGNLSQEQRADFHVWGTLANSDVLDNVYIRFQDYGNIAIVPEPATMFILGLGGLMLRRKR